MEIKITGDEQVGELRGQSPHDMYSVQSFIPPIVTIKCQITTLF